MYQRLNLHLKLLYIHRNLVTSNALSAKRWVGKDPGIRRRANLFDKEDRMNEEIDDDEDIEGMESDFSTADISMSQMKREQYHRRAHVGRMMTVKKFFSGPKPPNMLMWVERQEIKRLYEKDPEEWNLDVLSECFPANRETISKIIRAKWIPENVQKIKKRDLMVVENWRRLADGSLQADQQLINHLQKFLGRREEYLAALKDGELTRLLPKPPPEKRWNNGKMSSILESYEKKLLELSEKQELLNGNAELPTVADGSAGIPSGSLLVKKNAITDQMADEDLNYANLMEKVKTPVTLAELRNILKDRLKADNVIQESGQGLDNTSKKQPVDEATAKGVSFNTNEDSERYLDMQSTQNNQTVENEHSAAFNEVTAPLYDRTNRTEATANINTERPQQLPNISIENKYEYKSELERQEFENEERSIDGTFFWPKEGAVKATQDFGSVGRNNKRFEKTSLPSRSDYPAKIAVPRSKRGTGLTFQVNDCFYDDDGEFLYRVPGISDSKRRETDSQNT